MARWRTWLCTLLVIYLALCGAVYLFQAALIFPGARASAGVDYRNAADEISLANEDVQLIGWHKENPEASNSTVIIYFGGNAEDVSWMQDTLKKMGAAHSYAFNYRGYGRSTGKPSQAALYSDALAIYDQVASNHPDPQTRFVIIGRSLGSAVAGHLANQRPTHALILLTPLKSLVDNSQRALPFLPVRWMLRHPLDLHSEAAHFSFPVLVVIAAQDQVIPPADSQATYDNIRSPKQVITIADVGHNDLFSNPAALIAVQQFLAEQASPAPATP